MLFVYSGGVWQPPHPCCLKTRCPLRAFSSYGFGFGGGGFGFGRSAQFVQFVLRVEEIPGEDFAAAGDLHELIVALCGGAQFVGAAVAADFERTQAERRTEAASCSLRPDSIRARRWSSQ